MTRTTYQIIKTTSDLCGEIVKREIHCLCSSVPRCIEELRRMYNAKWIGYPIIEKVMGERILVVDTTDSMVVYSIKEVAHIVKRPSPKYTLIPKNGRARDGRSYSNYGDALEEKMRLERLTGERYVIVK